MMDESGIPYAVLVSKLEEICQSGEPSKTGMLEREGQIVFGSHQRGMKVLVSLQEVRDFIEGHDLTDVPKNKLNLVFFVESLNPTIVEWHVFTQEQVDAMREEDMRDGNQPPCAH